MEKLNNIPVNRVFEGKPSEAFLEHNSNRLEQDDRYWLTDWDKKRRWDCEFPEFHQSEIDPNQTRTGHHLYDIVDAVLEQVDYKQFAKAGVKLSNETIRNIKSGLIKYLAIWKWEDRNIHRPIERGKKYSYEVLSYVKADHALKFIKADGDHMRFPYPLPEEL